MYKSLYADHPWRKTRNSAAYQHIYRRIGRDIKIGQLWILLAIFIVISTTVAGGIYATTLYQPPIQGELGKLLVDLNYKQVVMGCMIAIVQCIFLFVGSKLVYRLMVWQFVPAALVGLLGVAYLFSMPDTRDLAVVLAVALSPYFLCAGILTLSWRAKLYLDYMNGKF